MFKWLVLVALASLCCVCNALTLPPSFLPSLPSSPPYFQPSAAIVEKYLREIALKNNVDWTPLEQPSDLTGDQKAFSSMPAPTGASVGMGPASGFGHLYSNTGAGGGGGGAGGGGGGGGISMPIARPITPPPPSGGLSTSSSGAGGGKEGFQPPSRPPPPLPTQGPPPAAAAAAPTAPPSSPPFPPAAVEAEPSAPVVTAIDVEQGGDGGGEGGGEEYDIPLPPTTTPVMPEPEPELPPAPPTSGSGGPGGEVEDLLTRFQRLQQR